MNPALIRRLDQPDAPSQRLGQLSDQLSDQESERHFGMAGTPRHTAATTPRNPSPDGKHRNVNLTRSALSIRMAVYYGKKR